MRPGGVGGGEGLGGWLVAGMGWRLRPHPPLIVAEKEQPSLTPRSPPPAHVSPPTQWSCEFGC